MTTMILLIRKTLVAVAGTAVVCAGMVLIVLPGPLGFIVVPAGLTILATEFAWARALQIRMKKGTERVRSRVAASWKKMHNRG